MSTIVPPNADAQDANLPCASCASAGRRGYCALGRCYCGHSSCEAFASWYELPAPTSDATSTSATWTEREEATWLDKL